MILPDVNILLYAFRIDSRRHSDYHGWLEDTLNGDAPFGISSQTLASLIRISTHPRIYVNPSSLEEALSFCAAIVDSPGCTIVHPGDRHWSIFSGLCRDARVKGNLVQDAWFAALAIESGCEWITTDGDYARFPRLRWREPF
jgi:toxin-antitoxin system PIN domain toxin